MDLLVRVILLIGVLALFVFWAWMFWDLANNNRLDQSARTNWTLAFVFLNVFAACLYYVNEYRYRH